MTVIDFHTHLDEYWFGRPMLDRDRFLAGMDRCSVSKACIFTLRGFSGDCRRYNDALAAHARTAPDRLIPFVTVDPKEGDAAVRELQRCLSDPIFRGVKFHSWLQAFAPSMVRQTMLDILQCAADHEAPVFFHDGTPPYATTFQIAALARWAPQATIVLGHAGLADYVQPAAELARDLPNLYACPCGPKAGDIAHLVQTAGAHKVLFGSDFGFADWPLLAERLDDVLEAGLNEADLSKVMCGNASRLLRLEPS